MEQLSGQDGQFGTWFFYMIFASRWHIPLHSLLSLAGVPLYLGRRRTAMGAATCLATCSGWLFALSFAWGTALDENGAARLAGLLVAAAVVLAAALVARREPLAPFFRHCEHPDMVVISTCGALIAFALAGQLPFLRRLPFDGDALAFAWVAAMVLYWCPAILIPRRMLVDEGDAGPPPAWLPPLGRL